MSSTQRLAFISFSASFQISQLHYQTVVLCLLMMLGGFLYVCVYKHTEYVQALNPIKLGRCVKRKQKHNNIICKSFFNLYLNKKKKKDI